MDQNKIMTLRRANLIAAIIHFISGAIQLDQSKKNAKWKFKITKNIWQPIPIAFKNIYNIKNNNRFESKFLHRFKINYDNKIVLSLKNENIKLIENIKIVKKKLIKKKITELTDKVNEKISNTVNKIFKDEILIDEPKGCILK